VRRIRGKTKHLLIVGSGVNNKSEITCSSNKTGLDTRFINTFEPEYLKQNSYMSK
jgi:hypothetical protein